MAASAFNATLRQGVVVGYLCPDCQTPEEVGLLGGGLHCSVRPVWVRAGEPLRRATLSRSLCPELGIRSFSKLDQTDHIGRWGGAESECVLEHMNRMK
jgi:hypothetical protein